MNDGPDNNEDAHLQFAATLPVRHIADALDGAQPLTDLQPNSFPASRRRGYDEVRDFPDGLLLIGDAIASFNPICGPGMTIDACKRAT